MKRLSWNEVETELENSMSPLPKPLSPAELQKLRDDAPTTPSTVRGFPTPYTNEELALLSAAAQRKGAPLDDRERAAALGRKYDEGDPLGLRRLNTPPRVLEVQ